MALRLRCAKFARGRHGTHRGGRADPLGVAEPEPKATSFPSRAGACVLLGGRSSRGDGRHRVAGGRRASGRGRAAAGAAREVIMDTMHKQVKVKANGREAMVDVGIAPLIKQLWLAGIDTWMSCENRRPGAAW